MTKQAKQVNKTVAKSNKSDVRKSKSDDAAQMLNTLLAKRAAAKSSKSDASEAKNAKTFTLAELARELNILEKVARAKARRRRDEVNAIQKQADHKWRFDAKHRAAVTAFLTN
jgi:hypothetical protein